MVSLDPYFVGTGESCGSCAHQRFFPLFNDCSLGLTDFGFLLPALRLLHQDLRKGDIERRKHTPSKVFTRGPDATELVILGTVEYWAKGGQYTKKNMISHFEYRRDPVAGDIEVCALAVWLS